MWQKVVGCNTDSLKARGVPQGVLLGSVFLIIAFVFLVIDGDYWRLGPTCFLIRDIILKLWLGLCFAGEKYLRI